MTGWQKGNYELKTKNHERPDPKPPRSFADLVPLPTGSYPIHTNIMRLIENFFINPKPGCLGKNEKLKKMNSVLPFLNQGFFSHIASYLLE